MAVSFTASLRTPIMAALVALSTACARPASVADPVPSPLPGAFEPRPTSAAVSVTDLMSRLYLFADDSMQGRETGTAGHVQSTAYLADEMRRLGLDPAGDRGSYFQHVPMMRRALHPQSTLTVTGEVLRAGADFITATRGTVRPVNRLQVVFGGMAGDTLTALSAEQVRGRLVVLQPNPGITAATYGSLQRSAAFQRYLQAMSEAAGTASIGEITEAVAQAAMAPPEGAVFMVPSADAEPAPLALQVTARAATVLMGAPLDGLVPGTIGRTVQADIRYEETRAPARNVIAIMRGSDAVLRDEYVAIGAHSDHVGLSPTPVDHDSLHLYNMQRYLITAAIPRGQRPSAEQQARLDAIRVNLDSVRALRRPRPDSIRNGADDDGSGSVAMLEMAEALAAGPRPKRSILFVFHTAEEKGLLGARWFSEHPTVPREQIVAQLNMDMVGRGGAQDIPGGGPDYLQLVGSRRLSTELGDLVEAVNAGQPRPFRFDYSFDAPGHPENIYCRSDHYHYARWGIPAVFFHTGLHGDYHQVTDEPQYIDYPKLARVTRLVLDVATRVANGATRPVVDQPRPDPAGVCRQ